MVSYLAHHWGYPEIAVIALVIVAVHERGLVAVGLTNTTHFLRSMAAGRVEVEAVALNQGRSQQLWRVDITDGSGRLVAHGELRLQNLDPAGP